MAKWLFIHYLMAWLGISFITNEPIKAVGAVLAYHGLLIALFTIRRMHDAGTAASVAIAEASREAQRAMEEIRKNVQDGQQGPKQ